MQRALEIKNVFEQYIIKNKFKGQPQSLYDPMNYILSLKAKRARPLMLLMGYLLFDEHYKNALPAALAIEVFHNFTLLHDDIMDEAPLRRGQPSVHMKFDTNKAIIAGDAMMTIANQLLNSAESSQTQYILEQFDAAALAICEGQQMDMDFETHDDVSIEDYIEMIKKKTAVLLGVSLQIGALLGGASRDEAMKLYHFGEQFGISFQIQDDLLDTFGDQTKVGKQVGGDILQGKKTYLYLKTKDLLEGEELQRFTALYGGEENATKVDAVKSIFQSVAVDEYARQLRDAYHDLAFSHLKALGIDNDGMTSLVDYASTFIQRES